jgi:hypothetical protein
VTFQTGSSHSIFTWGDEWPQGSSAPNYFRDSRASIRIRFAGDAAGA